MLGFKSVVAQETLLKGRVVDSYSNQAIPNAFVELEGSDFKSATNELGWFEFAEVDLPLGEQVLAVTVTQYLTLRVPIVLNKGELLILDPILLELDLSDLESHIGIISLSDNELTSDEGTSFQVPGLLQASRDVFLNASAYDFSSAFFRPRGLDSRYGKVLINGMEMNKLFNGRPQWSNWGGLNDVQRSREFTMGLKPNELSFGDLAGTTNIVMRASQYRSGGQVSIAAANRSYQGRLMATYNSGILKSGWAYSVSAARRFGEEGYVHGTPYDANSFFISIEKKLGTSNTLGVTAFYTPVFRGRGTALTNEAREIKGIRYNPQWGLQNGRTRNSRIREIEEPVIQLNHYWKLSETFEINTHLGYQFGTIKNSRIDNNGTRLITGADGQSFFAGGARSVLANYYQRLPSYFLRNPDPSAYDYQLAYQALQEFQSDGQLDWEALYRANSDEMGNPGLATYVLQNDVSEDVQLSATVQFTGQLSERLRINGSLVYRDLSSENYAEVADLLGSSGYLDIDSFTQAASGDAGNELQTSAAQSDLRNPNRVATLNDRYKYNYRMDATSVSGFAQLQLQLPYFDGYLGATAGKSRYQRTGMYENGNFPGDQSFGPSDALSFSTYGVKGGGTYKITGRHLVDANAAFMAKAPPAGRVFSNPRQNNETIIGIAAETIQSLDVSYIFRSPSLKVRLTGFYNLFEDQVDLGFYFTENISGLGLQQDAFVQEVMTGIDTRSMGVEGGIEAQVTSTFKVKAAGSFGLNTYTNNPDLYLRSDDFQGALTFGDGTAKLRNYHVAAGPERVYQLGVEYRDPGYWWVGVTGNYFSHAYIDVNNLARTANFTSDFDGQPFNDYNEEEGLLLLEQEKIQPYLLFNIVGGKSWRISRYFIGFFASVANLLNREYTTGGFEQGRLTNFRNRREDANRDNGPIFGTRYFFGSGTTYFLNLYFRF